MGTILTEAKKPSSPSWCVTRKRISVRRPLPEMCEEFGFASHTAALSNVQASRAKGFVTQTGDGAPGRKPDRKKSKAFLLVCRFTARFPPACPWTSRDRRRTIGSTRLHRLRTTKV